MRAAHDRKKLTVWTVASIALVVTVGSIWPWYRERRLLEQLESDDRAKWTAAADALFERVDVRRLPVYAEVVACKDADSISEWQDRLYSTLPVRYEAALPGFIAVLSRDDAQAREIADGLFDHPLWRRRAVLESLCQAYRTSGSDAVARAILSFSWESPEASGAAIPALLMIAKSRHDVADADAAAELLVRIGLRGGPNELLAFLNAARPEISWAASYEFARLGRRAAAVRPRLIEMLSSADEELRWRAAVALTGSGLGTREMVPSLVALLRSAIASELLTDWHGLPEFWFWDSFGGMSCSPPVRLLHALARLDPAHAELVPLCVELRTRFSWIEDDVCFVLGQLREQGDAATRALVRFLIERVPKAWSNQNVRNDSDQIEGVVRGLVPHRRRAVPLLVEVVRTTKDSSARQASAIAIGHLAEAGRDEIRDGDRLAAIEALGSVTERFWDDAVSHWARRHLGVRENAFGLDLVGLSGYEDLPPMPILPDVDRVSIDRIEELLDKEYGGYVSLGARIAAKYPSDRVCAKLLAVACDAKRSVHVRVDCLRSVRSMPEFAEQCVPRLVESMRASAVDARGWDSYVLWWLDPWAGDALEDLLRASYELDVETLGDNCDLERAIETLVEIAPSDERVWKRVLECVERHPELVDELDELEVDDRVDTRPLRRFLRHRSAFLRVASARLLWRVEKRAGDVLTTLRWGLESLQLESEDDSFIDMGPIDERELPVLRESVIALGEMGPAADPAAERLRECFDVRRPILTVRIAAALWKFREETSVDELETVLRVQSPLELDEEWCDDAFDLLGEFASVDDDAVRALERLRAWFPDHATRRKIDAISKRAPDTGR